MICCSISMARRNCICSFFRVVMSRMGGGHQDALGAFQRAQHDLDRKRAAVLAPADQLDPGADLLRQRIFRGAQRVGDQPLRETLRNDVLDRLPTSASRR